MDFLLQFVQIHFFLKQHKTGIPRIITLLLFPFHLCKEFLSLLNVFWLKLALKPYFMFSSVFHKRKDVICDEKKRDLVYEIPCRDCDAVYVGETGRSLSTRKKEYVKAVKEMNLQKSALCQHIVTCDHFIAWDDASILKIEPHYRKRRIAKSFLINKRAKDVNVLNQNDGLVLPSIYSMLLD